MGVAEPLSAESARRIAEVLRQQILGAQPSVIDGAWSMLASEGAGWHTHAQLDAAVYAQMRGHFGDDIIREVLLAAAGVKLSRTCLTDGKTELLRGIAARRGFHVLASEERFIHRPDTGKGGASNRIEGSAAPGDSNGLRNVYIASDASVVEAGKLLEEVGDDEIFGTLLGIPTCCREAYARSKFAAMAKQMDFVTLVLDNTAGAMPYDPWLNYVAQYFGRTLLSFFPCSFRCAAAGMAARMTFEMLAECDRAWAQSFLDLQRTNILYTEYEGLHLFRRPLVDGTILYGPDDFDSTAGTNVADLIRRGDRLEVREKRRVEVYRGAERIGVLGGDDVGMCAFC